LVFTVQQTAVGVLEPTVLVHAASGSAYLIVLSLGRCVYGWPLRVQSAEKMLLVMAHPIRALIPIVLTSAHLGPAIQIPAIAFAIVFFISQCRKHNRQTNNPLIAPQCFGRYGGDPYLDLPVRVACETLGGQVLQMSCSGMVRSDAFVFGLGSRIGV
jgi:hypothetical protein